jgi:hypothetical protein
VDDELASIGLAADGEKVAAADPDTGTPSVDTPEPAPAAPVLDTDKLADTVREANEEGKRLAERGADDSTVATAPRGRIAPQSGRAALKSPGELIDTNEWYLTLPTGEEGSPDTVEGSRLATYHSKFFDLTGKRDGIVFHAGADGVTTKNSHYPRSELREMNGTEKASWSTRPARTSLRSARRSRSCPTRSRRSSASRSTTPKTTSCRSGSRARR